VAPIVTLFIGGNHEASNHLWELYVLTARVVRDEKMRERDAGERGNGK